VAVSRATGDGSVSPLTLAGMARVAMGSGDPARAAGLLDEAQASSRAAGDWFSLVATLSIKAVAARQRGDDRLTEGLLVETVRLSAELRDAWHLVYGVTGLAGLAARQGEPQRAARLLGAVEAQSETMGVEVPGWTWRDLDHDAHLNARHHLGDAAYDAEWSRGRAMTFEQAAAEALRGNAPVIPGRTA
jgi:non-specific serine/threonine protein kinase